LSASAQATWDKTFQLILDFDRAVSAASTSVRSSFTNFSLTLDRCESGLF
jgi:hypothetical protein